MSKKANWLEFSQLPTKNLLKKLDEFGAAANEHKTKILLGKSTDAAQIKKLKNKIAQINTLINQRIIAEAQNETNS